jgi:CheY-like chemotaxis protein
MKNIIIASSLLQDLEANKTILTRHSISFLPAGSSEEIIHLHEEKRADLIITDASLPIMGGVKLCTHIRSVAELKYVSIIVVGEEADPSFAQCREAGANIVIPKPVDYSALLWKASELLVVPQRKDIRAVLHVSVQGMEGGRPLFAQSQNISISGMLLSTDHLLSIGDMLSCSFSIGHSEVAVQCEVTRAEMTTVGRHWYGVRLVNCDRRSLVIIDQFIRAQQEE